MPIDRAEANRRARIYADHCSPKISVVLIPVAEIPAEMPYGWWFQYQSKRYVETGNHREMLLGPGPFVINRQTGNVWTAGSSWGRDETLTAYESSLFDGRSRMENEQEFDGDRLLEREPWPYKDWSRVDSLTKALELHRAGTLDKVLLVPSELGGHDSLENTVYVPYIAAAHKRVTDRRFTDLNPATRRKARYSGPLVSFMPASHQDATYSATPVYRTPSVVPVQITIEVRPGPSTHWLTIWGNRPPDDKH